MTNDKELELAMRDFVFETDKRSLFVEVLESMKFMVRSGISVKDAIYTVKNLVREVRNNYGD